MTVRWTPILIAAGCGNYNGDVAMVALDDGSVDVDAATAQVDVG